MHPRPWRRGSIFGEGRRVPLDRNQRARWRFLLTAHRRARRLTRSGLDVGEALLKRLGEDGRLDPSQRTLAADADCSDRTVRTALATMRTLGLLRWQNGVTGRFAQNCTLARKPW
jgi:DNA-binding FadR family transcriptional regulator